MGLDNASGHVESQTEPFDTLAFNAPPEEAFKQTLLISFRDSYSLIENRHDQIAAVMLRGDGNLAALGRVLDRIADEIVQDLFEAVAVPVAFEGPTIEGEYEGVISGDDAKSPDYVFQDRAEIHALLC